MPPASPSPATPDPTVLYIVVRSLRAAKQNLIPALVLQAFAIAIGLGYYYVPAIHAWLVRIGALKDAWGYGFSIVSTAVFAGVIPWAVQYCRPRHRPECSGVELAFFTLFWAFKGVEVDALYRLQAFVFGDDNDVLTLVFKVLCDQLLYVPLWAAPTMALAYAFKHNDYKLRSTLGFFRRGWYRRKGLPVLIPNWLVWVPAVAVIYALPLPLQLPMQNLVLCFWAILLMFVTQKEGDVVASG